MADSFFTQQQTANTARKAAAVTPNDGTDLANFAVRGLYVGGAGALVLDPIDGAPSVTFSAVPAGTYIPLQVRRVRATGTTATAIIALY